MESEGRGEDPKLLASLPWYDVADAGKNLDSFWRVLRRELEKAGTQKLPTRLDRSMPLRDQWQWPGLVISQCCGLDLFTSEAQSLVPIARPVFSDVTGQTGSYFSHIVATEPLNQMPRRAVVNGTSSRSGCAALLEWATERDWLELEVVISGSHVESVRYLKDGLAEVAAIDAHSWNLFDTRGLSIIGRSSEAPAPPFVSNRACPVSPETLLQALTRAMEMAGEPLGISGVIPANIDDYRHLRPQSNLLERYRARAG